MLDEISTKFEALASHGLTELSSIGIGKLSHIDI